MISRAPKQKWLLFLGKILKSTNGQVDLYATDGSEGVIRVNKEDTKKIGDKIYIALGCKAQTITPPRNYQA